MTREKQVPFLVPRVGESVGYIRLSSGFGENVNGVVYKNGVELRTRRFRFGGKKKAAGVCRGCGESMDFEY
jgi:hypothetical protein